MLVTLFSFRAPYESHTPILWIKTLKLRELSYRWRLYDYQVTELGFEPRVCISPTGINCPLAPVSSFKVILGRFSPLGSMSQAVFLLP
jgi:hypothetical protein